MSNLFAIGIYVPQAGASSPYGPYDPTLPTTSQDPLSGSYDGGYALTYYEDIPPPNSVRAVPGAALATGLSGAPIVRAYETMTWGYDRIRADRWYWLYTLFRLTRRSAGANAGHVAIRWPDPLSGTTQTSSARWDAIASATRSVSGIEQVTLTFSHLGFDDATAPTGIYVPTLGH